MNKKNAQIALVLILLLGAFLRIYGLGDESFWLDEMDTVESTNHAPHQIIKTIYTKGTFLPQYFGEWGGSLPLHYILTNYWTKIVGLSEFKLRLFSALFGTLSVYLIFLIGKFLFNREIGLIASFILAINHQHIYFSQEAWLYSTLIALTLLSVLSLLHALKDNKNLYWGIFVISAGLLLYTHHFSFFILLFQGLFILLYWKKYKIFLKKMIFSGIAVFLLYLPWIPALINQLSYGPPIGRTIGAPTLSKLIMVLTQFNSWVSPDLDNRIALRTMDFLELTTSGWLLIVSVIIIALLLGFAFIRGLFCAKDKKLNIGSLKDHKIVFLLLWFLIPIFVPFLISVISPNNAVFSSVRYVLFASPAYYLVASLGISKLRNWKTLFLVLLTLFSIFPLYSHYANFESQQWREASKYLQLNRSPDEHLFIQKANNILPLEYYYSDMANIVPIDTIDQVIPSLEGKQSFWLVLALEKYSDPKGLVKSYVDSHYTLIEKKEFSGIKIFYYIKPQPISITSTNN
jgi:4-amino-4-deoxy-L-arabinose transferase-like glycosyltransferase